MEELLIIVGIIIGGYVLIGVLGAIGELFSGLDWGNAIFGLIIIIALFGGLALLL